MAIQITGTFEPTGDFPLAKAKDIEMDDGTRLSDLDPSAGKDGVGIQSIEQWYYKSNYPEDYKGGSWSRVYPDWEDGYYLWTKTVITLTDGTSVETSPICVTGSKGEKGDKGDPGDGASITVDAALDPNSTNPVQNKVIYAKMEEATSMAAEAMQQILAMIPTEAQINALIDSRFVPMTQAEYDALTEVDPNKYYMIVG